MNLTVSDLQMGEAGALEAGKSGGIPCRHFVHVFEDQNGLKRINRDQFGSKSLGFSERSFILLG